MKYIVFKKEEWDGVYQDLTVDKKYEVFNHDYNSSYSYIIDDVGTERNLKLSSSQVIDTDKLAIDESSSIDKDLSIDESLYSITRHKDGRIELIPKEVTNKDEEDIIIEVKVPKSQLQEIKEQIERITKNNQ